jgi:hypothetical protein
MEHEWSDIREKTTYPDGSATARRRSEPVASPPPGSAPSQVLAQRLEMDQVVTSRQDRLRHRDQQLAPAQPSPALLEGTHAVDGGVEVLDEASPMDQLAAQEQTGVGRQRGVVGAFVDDTATWSGVGFT